MAATAATTVAKPSTHRQYHMQVATTIITIPRRMTRRRLEWDSSVVGQTVCNKQFGKLPPQMYAPFSSPSPYNHTRLTQTPLTPDLADKMQVCLEVVVMWLGMRDASLCLAPRNIPTTPKLVENTAKRHIDNTEL